MFSHDRNLYPLVIDMLRDERMRVRLGAAALVEELVNIDREPLVILIPSISELLSSDNPIQRADAAYVLSLIGHPSALSHLIKASDDAHPQVREVIMDALEDIRLKSGQESDCF
jgi:hypothetical protein